MSDDLKRDQQIAHLLEEIRQKQQGTGEFPASQTPLQPEAPDRFNSSRFQMQSAEFPIIQPEGSGGSALPEVPERSKRPARPDLSRRRIMGALNAGADQKDLEDDPINKSMLAPTIERGIDVEIEGPGETEDHVFRASKLEMEDHPVFAQPPVTHQIFIPKEQIPPDPNLSRPLGQDIVVENYKLVAEQKRVLNVKDNLDENFREFFNNTVVIDRESLMDKLRRQRKIKNFVPVNAENTIGAPVFEDDGQAEPPEDADPLEYRSEEDTDAILARLMARRASATVRLILTALFALLAVLLSLMAQWNGLPDVLMDPPVFYACHLGLLALATAFHFKSVFGGVGRLLVFRADGGSLAGFAVLAAWAEGILYLLSAERTPHGLYGSVAVAALFFIAWGNWLDARRLLGDFRLISGAYDKYASSVLENQGFTQRLTQGMRALNATILLQRPTRVTDHFAAHANSRAPYLRKVFVLASIALYVALLCGGYMIVVESASPAETAGVVCGAAVLCAPFAATFAGSLPIFRTHRKLNKLGAVVPGYSAAEEVCDANFVVLEGRELFPTKNVRLHGIKTFERERIDKAILYAASVLIPSCDTMAPMFRNVIQNKTEMLYAADSIEYEAGRGYSFWIDQNRMLLGTRELMRVHDIEIPTRDYEARYTRGNMRDAMYLAVAGRLYALFVISYTASPEVAVALEGFVREGIGILIHTRDFNITSERVAQLYQVPAHMVGVIREDAAAELAEHIGPAPHAPSSLTHIGSLTSFVNGVGACLKLRSALRMAATIEWIGLLVGMGLGVVLTLIGSMLGLGVLRLLLFQLIWWLILFIPISARRY